MNREVMIYENEEFGQVRTMMIDGEAWFVGRDVAEILGYQNGSKIIGYKDIGSNLKTIRTVFHPPKKKYERK